MRASPHQSPEEWLQARVNKRSPPAQDARDRLSKPGRNGRQTVRKVPGRYAAQVAVEAALPSAPSTRFFRTGRCARARSGRSHASAAYDVETGNIVQEVGAIVTDDDLFCVLA